MRYCFVFNPAARSQRAGRRRAWLEEALRQRDVEHVVLVTERPGHGEALAREAARTFDAVVAVGGDGTVHEVARGLYGGRAALGVLPMGTGNDLAHALGMPDPLDAALDALLAAPLRPLDLGRVRWDEEEGGARTEHEALFANCVGAGFDAMAAREVTRYKWLGGRTAYLAAVLRTLRLWRGVDVEVESVGGGSSTLFAGPFFLAAFGNGYSVGGGFLLTPDAVPDDGLIDLCLVRHLPIKRVLRVLPSAFSGAHVREPEVAMHRGTRFRLRAAGPIPVYADGEVLTGRARALDVEVLPGALQALAPAFRRPATAAA